MIVLFIYPAYSNASSKFFHIERMFGYLPESVLSTQPLLLAYLIRRKPYSLHDLQFALREGEVKLQKALEFAEESLVLTDKNGVVRLVNNAMCLLSKYSKDELVGSSISIVVPPGIRDVHDSWIRDHVQRGDKTHFRMYMYISLV